MQLIFFEACCQIGFIQRAHYTKKCQDQSTIHKIMKSINIKLNTVNYKNKPKHLIRMHKIKNI